MDKDTASSPWVRFADIATATLDQLRAAIEAAVAEEGTLRGRLVELCDQRAELLLYGDDAELDALEAETGSVSRTLDRYDVRIPELRRILEERSKLDERSRNADAFEAAVTARIEAAQALDSALDQTAAAFLAFEQAGQTLAGLKPYHGVEVFDSGYRRLLIAGLKETAPAFGAALGALEREISLSPALIATSETARWGRVAVALAERSR